MSGNIEIRNLTFTYPGSENPVLKDISLTIKAGERVGIVGKTGSGKLKLLLCESISDKCCRMYSSSRERWRATSP